MSPYFGHVTKHPNYNENLPPETRAVFHHFHTKAGQFLLHIVVILLHISYYAEGLCASFSAAIYQWSVGFSKSYKVLIV